MEILSLASGSSGNAYLIGNSKGKFLIEAGIPWKRIQTATGFRTNDIQFALVSHAHGDHSKYVKDVIKAGIDVYSSEECFRELNLSGHRVHPVEAMKQFTIGTYTIMPFDLEHDIRCFGFLIHDSETDKKLVFITDSFYCKYCFSGINIAMIEINYSKDILNANVASGRLHKSLKTRLLRSHMSLENAIEFFKANDLSKLEEIWLLHLSDQNSNAEQFKTEIEKLTGIPVKVC